jgi:hypothetical protein
MSSVFVNAKGCTIPLRPVGFRASSRSGLILGSAPCPQSPSLAFRVVFAPESPCRAGAITFQLLIALRPGRRPASALGDGLRKLPAPGVWRGVRCIVAVPSVAAWLASKAAPALAVRLAGMVQARVGPGLLFRREQWLRIGVRPYLLLFCLCIPFLAWHKAAHAASIAHGLSGALHQVMSRGDWREAIYHDDVDRQECVKTLAEELKRMGWTAADLERRCRSDPGKLGLAARLRKETVLTIKSIAVRVHLGSSHTANANLHAWMSMEKKRKVK